MKIKYNAYRGDMNDLESFILNHQNILDRCSFEEGWRWIWNGKGANQTYVSRFNVHLHNEPVTDDFFVNKNKKFFDGYVVSRSVGHWLGELFDKLTHIKKQHNLDVGCSMSIKSGCYSYEQHTNIEDINKLAALIQTELDLKTRIEKIGRSNYRIYIHSDQTILDQLQITPPAKKPNKKTNNSSLLLEEQRLIKELEKVRKKLKKP